MSDILYRTPLRSSLPQQRWREEADAQARRRAAVEEAGRKRERAAAQLHTQVQNATAATTVEHELAALRSELAQAHEIMRDALVEFLVNENAALRLDLERKLKRQVAEIEINFESKVAGLRMPRVRGTYSEIDHYREHDIVIKNGGSYISRRDNPGPLPGSGWQQLTQPGRTGAQGPRGYAGERGAQGASGANFVTWRIDAKNYTATPLMSDGKPGPILFLRELFEQFFSETAREGE